MNFDLDFDFDIDDFDTEIGSEDVNQVTRTVKPWLKSVKQSMDKILKP